MRVSWPGATIILKSMCKSENLVNDEVFHLESSIFTHLVSTRVVEKTAKSFPRGKDFFQLKFH